jgi:hypothetical protein
MDPFLADSPARSTGEHVKGSYRALPLERIGHGVLETARDELTHLVLDHILER